MIYHTELETTSKNMKNSTGSFQTFEDPEHDWMWDGFPVKILGVTELKI